MKFQIKRTTKEVRNRKPHYTLNINFMEGDADGYETTSVEVDEDNFHELHPLILAVEACNHGYPRGKGGYDDYNGLPEYDAFFSENEEFNSDFYENLIPGSDKMSDKELQEAIKAIHKKINPYEYDVQHPYGNEEVVTSFDGYTLIYTDENGDSFPVEIEFDEEEQKRFKEVSLFLK